MLTGAENPPDGDGSPRTHWLDRLAVRLAARDEARADPGRATTVLGARISRRRALIGSAAFVAGLTIDTTRVLAPEASASVGVACADPAYKDCLENAESAYKEDLKGRIKGSGLDRSLAGATGLFNWTVFRNYCAQHAAQRHCGPCETCGGEAGTCLSICEADQVCQNGKCVCAPCFEPSHSLFGIGCDPVECPSGQECNPNTGQCEPTCDGQTGGDLCAGASGAADKCCPPGSHCCGPVGDQWLCCPDGQGCCPTNFNRCGC